MLNRFNEYSTDRLSTKQYIIIKQRPTYTDKTRVAPDGLKGDASSEWDQMNNHIIYGKVKQ